jgi:M6 family metalloprotease-like protein
MDVPAQRDVPVILIQYADESASESRQSFDDMMNQDGYSSSGSFAEYFAEVSYNNHSINGTVVGWYTASENRAYYAFSDPDHYLHAAELVREAVDAAEAAGIDFSGFDADNDGEVDAVFVVHQGQGAEDGSNDDFLWSHHWYLSSAGSGLDVEHDGKTIDRYIIMPETYGGAHVNIGVYCHEYGHVLGLPDLYDTDDSEESEGIGNWGLMAGGSWGGDGASPDFPSHLSAWSKMELEWLVPLIVQQNIIGQNIPSIESNAFALQIWTEGAPQTEYFLVSNRQQTGFDRNLPGCGLLVWHVDETVGGNQDETHKKVDLESADGNLDLDDMVNRGDGGDPFPGSSNNTNFEHTTDPNSDSYGGLETGVGVLNISSCAATMTADIVVGLGLRDLALIIDRSGSMSPSDKLPRAKAAARYFVDDLRVGDQITVSSFASSGSLVAALTRITDADPGHAIKVGLKNAINSIYASGMTAFGAGLQVAYGQLAGSPVDEKYAVFMSNGNHNTGSYTSQVANFAARGWPIYTVAFGSLANESSLRWMASQTGGEFYSATTTDIQAIYDLIQAQLSGRSVVTSIASWIGSGQSIQYPV